MLLVIPLKHLDHFFYHYSKYYWKMDLKEDFIILRTFPLKDQETNLLQEQLPLQRETFKVLILLAQNHLIIINQVMIIVEIATQLNCPKITLVVKMQISMNYFIQQVQFQKVLCYYFLLFYPFNLIILGIKQVLFVPYCRKMQMD